MDYFAYFAFFAANFLDDLRKDCCHDFVEPLLHLRIVGNSPGYRDVAGPARGDAFFNQSSRVDQHARTRAFFNPVFAQVSYLVTKFGEL
jgi:hypothetical protein